MKARDFMPAVRYGAKWYPEDLVVAPLNKGNRYWFVDGDKAGDGGGKSWEDAFLSIQSAVTSASAGDVIYIAERTITSLAIDPVSYAETVIIPNNKPSLSLVGVSRGITQGGLPQIRIGGGAVAMLDIKAPGCLVANLGFNGASSTGGGILLRDNGTDPATTATSFGTTIVGCHFKNCKAHATDGAKGGAIYSLEGASAPWQIRISGNRFYKCLGGVIIPDGSAAVPQDWIIEDNVFGNSVNTETDGDIFVGSGGILGVQILRNYFASVDGCASSFGTIQHYIELNTGSYGIVADNRFACKTGSDDTPMTFGSSTHTAVQLPTTVRMANNWGEAAVGSIDNAWGAAFRTD